MANESDIAQVLAVISAAFPNFKMQEMTPKVYLELLGDIPADELKAAVLQCCGEPGRAFAPSVGELRGAVAEIRRAIQGVPSSYEAWEEVRKRMAGVGGYRSAEWSHPLIEKTVNTFGWRNLCMSEDQTSDRARFIACYEQYAERAVREEIRPAQVRHFIEDKKQPLLDVTAEMRRLAEGKKA